MFRGLHRFTFKTGSMVTSSLFLVSPAWTPLKSRHTLLSLCLKLEGIYKHHNTWKIRVIDPLVLLLTRKNVREKIEMLNFFFFFWYTCWRLDICFGEMPVKSWAHLKNWAISFFLFSCRSYLYILEIKPLSNLWFSNIFSHSTSSVFTLSIISFMEKMLNITNHQGNANLKHNEIAPHTCQDSYYHKPKYKWWWGWG